MAGRARPWVAYNAQGQRLGRFVSDAAIVLKYPEAAKAGLIQMEYKPRKAKVKRAFPYEGTGRL